MSKSNLSCLKAHLKGNPLNQKFLPICHVCNCHQYLVKPQGSTLCSLHALVHAVSWSSQSEVSHWIPKNCLKCFRDLYQVLIYYVIGFHLTLSYCAKYSWNPVSCLPNTELPSLQSVQIMFVFWVNESDHCYFSLLRKPLTEGTINFELIYIYSLF